MAIQDYFPSRDAELTDWTTNFDAKLDTYANTIGITPTEKSALHSVTQDIRSAITENTQAQATAKQATADKNTRVKADELIIRGIVKRAKTSNGFSDAIGKDFDVIGIDDASDWNNYKPVITAGVFPGHITIGFRKRRAGREYIHPHQRHCRVDKAGLRQPQPVYR